MDFPATRETWEARLLTIAEVLKPAKYSTYLSGKWHHPEDLRKFATQLAQTAWIRPVLRNHSRGGQFLRPEFPDPSKHLDFAYADPEYKPKEFYYTDAINDHATRFINEHKGDDPFFLYIAHTAPHWPMHALPEDIEKYKGRYDEGWEAIRAARYQRQLEMGLIDPKWKLSKRDAQAWKDAKNKEWEIRLMEVYAAMVDRLDQGLGKVIGALEKRKMLDDTLIMFIADNGGCAEGMGSRRGHSVQRQGPRRPQAHEGDRFANGHDPQTNTRRGGHETGNRGHVGRSGYLSWVRTGLGKRQQHALPGIQALGARGRNQHAVGRSLAQGNRS